MFFVCQTKKKKSGFKYLPATKANVEKITHKNQGNPSIRTHKGTALQEKKHPLDGNTAQEPLHGAHSLRLTPAARQGGSGRHWRRGADMRFWLAHRKMITVLWVNVP